MNAREQLPMRRRSVSAVVRDRDGREVHLMVGFYDDGRPGECFIETGRIGSSAWAIAHDAAVGISIGLQHGIPLDIFRHAQLKLRDGTSASIVGIALDAVAALAS